METRLLCAYDGSDDAERAIAVAGQLVRGDAIVLYVWQPVIVPPLAGAPPPEAVLRADHTQAPALHSKCRPDRHQRSRRPLSRPALDTSNGTTKFSAQRTQVAVVASPDVMTLPWLMTVSTSPTTNAMRS